LSENTEAAYQFKQVIDPLPRGRVRFCLNSIYGYMPKAGYLVTPNFLVHRDEGARAWTLTHKRSGRYVTYAKTINEAKRIARRLERIGDWSRIPISGAMSKRFAERAKAIARPITRVA